MFCSPILSFFRGRLLPGLALAIAISGFSDAVCAESRTWTSADGKKKIEAELISATAESVTIKRSDGKEATVPLSRFSAADQDFVKDFLAQGSLNEELEKNIKRKVLRFYQVVRKSPELDDLRPLLTQAAREKFETNSSFFETITGPDRGKSALVKHVDIDEGLAVAIVSAKISGHFRTIEIGLEDEQGDWFISSLTYEADDGKKTMDFAAGQVVDPNAADSAVAVRSGSREGPNDFVATSGRAQGGGHGDGASERPGPPNRRGGNGRIAGLPTGTPPHAAPPPDPGLSQTAAQEAPTESDEQEPEETASTAGHRPGHGDSKEPAEEKKQGDAVGADHGHDGQDVHHRPGHEPSDNSEGRHQFEDDER